MTKHPENESAVPLLGAEWFDPLEAQVRQQIRRFLEERLEEEVAAALPRGRYERVAGAAGHRNGHRDRQLVGSFGPVSVSVPRARVPAATGALEEWHSRVLPASKRLTRQAEALIAGAYLSGTNPRRVRRALAARFGGMVGKDTLSRVWQQRRADGQAWQQRSLADEDIIRLLRDGTVVRVRRDRKATSLSLLVALGVRRDGQKVLLAVRNMGGASEAAWRALRDDMIARGLPTPERLIGDGGRGLAKALAGLWPTVPVPRCTVPKHRNLLAHAPQRLYAEITADYTDLIVAKTAKEVESRRQAFLRKWRVKCRAIADSLEEASAELFTFLRFPEEQWRSIRTTNAIERWHEEFKRRIKTQCLLPCAETAGRLFWALLASGQITMRTVDGWPSLHVPPAKPALDLAA